MPPDFILHGGGQGARRQGTGAVTGMDTGKLNMFHNAADHDLLTVAQRVHINLGGVVQEFIDQNRSLRGHGHGLAHIASQARLVIHQFHGPAAQDIGGTDQHRIGDGLGNGHGFLNRPGRAVGRLPEAKLFEQQLEPFAVLGPVNGIRRRAQNRHPGLFKRHGQLERRLPAELDNDAIRLFTPHDTQHIFQRQRLKIQLVGRVIIRTDGLGVTVHHNGFKAVFFERKGRVHAAIVELNALADPIRPATQNDHLLAVGRLGLVFAFVG